MSKTENSQISPLRRVGRVTAWLIGGFLILMGLLGLGDTQPGSLIMALGSILAGAVLLPPVTAFSRERWTFLHPFWIPPVTAVALIFTAAVSGPGLSTTTGDGVGVQSMDEGERRVADVAEVERLLADSTEESAGKALSVLRRYRADTLEGGALRSLLDQATAIQDAARLRTAAQTYVTKINDENMPKVEAIFTGQAESILTITLNLKTMDDAAHTLADGERYATDPEAKAAMDKLRATLARKQRAALPVMRASYGKLMDRQLWEADTDVVVQGTGSRTVRFISAIFAANRNIAQVQQRLGEDLYPLRFRRSQYEWYRGSETTYYTLETPDDGEIGYWSGMVFTPVRASAD